MGGHEIPFTRASQGDRNLLPAERFLPIEQSELIFFARDSDLLKQACDRLSPYFTKTISSEAESLEQVIS